MNMEDICETGPTSSKTRGRMIRTKWRRERKKMQIELTYYQSFSKDSGPQRRKGQYPSLSLSLLNLRSVTVEISPTRVTRVVYPDNW